VSDDRLGEVGPRIAAEKDDVAADPMESHHRLGHPGVVDVTFGVDAEAVVTKTLFGWTRFDTAEVDASAGELFQDLKQRARVIITHEQDHRALIGSSCRADGSGPRDQHKSRNGVWIVGDVFGERNESVEFAGNLRADRRVESRSWIGHLCRGSCCGAALGDHRVGQIGCQPVAALCCSMGMGQHAAYLG
jgi:hypothetical protein